MPNALPPHAKPGAPKLVRIKGKLLSGKRRQRLEGINIIIFAATAKNPTDEDYFPVAAGVTETNGYFFTSQLSFPNPADADKLTGAKALIGLDSVVEKIIRLTPTPAAGSPSEGTSRPGLVEKLPEKVVEVLNRLPKPFGKQLEKLLAEWLTPTSAGRLPDRLILFVDDGGVEESSSECGCGVLNFHEKKAIDEFSFYTVLRTTEPTIEASTIGDIDEVSLEELLGKDNSLLDSIKGVKVGRKALEQFLNKKAGLTKETLPLLLDLDRAARLRKRLRDLPLPKGRVTLNDKHAIDWDDQPTIYQATSVAHGRLLHFKQEWFGDGYSIGDLLYSLPLAPGQRKQIVVFDWDRRESAANTQQLDYQESLYNSLSRDRDVNEIAEATLFESLKGHSDATTSGVGWGVGGGALGIIPAGDVPIPFGLLAGVAGGTSKGSSKSNLTGERTATASSEQHIQDNTIQAANAVRSQRATIIQTVSQGERFEVSAEAVANYNHCHAMTVQYFEVLRHFQVQTRLAGVQECLFIPLKMTPFDRTKALRWRGILVRLLRRRDLAPAFDALERVDEELSGSDNYYDAIGFPKKMFAQEEIEYVEGELYIEFHLMRPRNDDDDKFVEANWDHLRPYIGSPREYYDSYLRSEKKRDEIFAGTAGARIAEAVLRELRVTAIRSSGAGSASAPIPVDFTLLSDFRNRQPLHVSLRMAGAPKLKRDDIDAVRIGFRRSRQAEALRALLGNSLKLIVRSGSLRYRTANLSEYLFKDTQINNDLTLDGDLALVATPLNRRELRNPRLEDVEMANALLRHLNENLEYYHQCIWSRMDPQRRFMLLDGIIAPGNANGRSVASVVENRLIGIAGNSLVMPVAPGFRLDPTIQKDVDLFEHYYEDPRDPQRLSLPTKGVFAEAVMGSCNSCEKINEDRFWRWEQAPIPDSPTAIGTVTPPTPAALQPNLQGRDFPAPLINIQNAPDLPAPQGFDGLAQLLGNPNLFRDITGLTENQRNALQTLQRLAQSAEFFGQQGADLAKLAANTMSPNIEELKQAKRENLIASDKAREMYTKQAENRLERESSDQSRAGELIREREQLQQAVKESRIGQQEAGEISRLLKELREKESQSTLDRSEVKEIIKESERFEHESASGKTRIEQAPKPKKRDIQFHVTIQDPYGTPFTKDTIPANDYLLQIVGENGVDDTVSLQLSGTRFGGVLKNAALSNAQLTVQLFDTTVASDNIVFSGVKTFNVAPDAKFVSVTATMKYVKQTTTKTNTTTHTSQIEGKLDISLGGKLSVAFKRALSKLLEVSAIAERSLGISGGISGGITEGTTNTTTDTLEVLLPTGGLDVVVN